MSFLSGLNAAIVAYFLVAGPSVVTDFYPFVVSLNVFAAVYCGLVALREKPSPA